MRIHHLDKYPLSERNSTYGGNSGDKEGIIVDGKNWIVKYPKRGSQLKGIVDLSYSQTPKSIPRTSVLRKCASSEEINS